MTILYLHGFASSGQSPKVDALRSAFPNQSIVAPDLPPEPKAAFAMISETIQAAYHGGEKKVLLIGTSMGGFYAWYAGARFDAPAIMVNPAIRPHQTTAQWLGTNKNFATGRDFEWEPRYLDQLEEMVGWVNTNYDPSQIEIVVSMDDAVLDAREIVDHFNNSRVHAFDDGGHRFDGWERVLPIVQDRHDMITEQVDPEF